MWKEGITVTNTVAYTGQAVGNEQTLWMDPNGGEMVQYSFDPNSQWLIRDDYILASNTGVSVIQSAYTWSIAANYTYVMEYTSRCNGSTNFSIDCYNYGYNNSDPGSVEGPQPPDPIAPQGAYRHSWAFLNSTTKNYYIRLFTDTTNKPNIQFSKLRFHRIEGINSNRTYKKCEAGVNVGKLPGSPGFALGAPTRSGHVFVGWYTDSGVYVDENYIMPNNELVIYARWKPIYTLDVNSRVNGVDWGNTGDLAIFDVYIDNNLVVSNTNDYYDNINLIEGTSYNINNIRLTNTYDWAYDGTVYNNISGILNTHTDVRLILNQIYRVFYNSNGGNNLSITEQQFHHGQSLILSQDIYPTKNNELINGYNVQILYNDNTINGTNQRAQDTLIFNFINWNTDPSGTGSSYNKGQSYNNNASMTLYAQWNSTTQKGSIILPTATELTRPNYELLGFAESATATSVLYQPGQTVTPSRDIVLYAIWKLKGSIVYINGEPYNIYIKDSSNGYSLYRAYIKDQSGWQSY